MCGLGAECPLRRRALLQAPEVACPQFMAIEDYLAKGDQEWGDGRLWILLLIDRSLVKG